MKLFGTISDYERTKFDLCFWATDPVIGKWPAEIKKIVVFWRWLFAKEFQECNSDTRLSLFDVI